MGVEDGQATHQQHQQAQSIGPVPQSGGQAMARWSGNDSLLQRDATLAAGSSLPSPSLHRQLLYINNTAAPNDGFDDFNSVVQLLFIFGNLYPLLTTQEEFVLKNVVVV